MIISYAISVHLGFGLSLRFDYDLISNVKLKRFD